MITKPCYTTPKDAIPTPMEAIEYRAVQTIVAEYNRISASLSETPKDHRPRFTKIDDQTFDPFDWDRCFLLEQGTRPSFGSPSFEVMPSLVISSRPSASSAETKRKATRQDVANVAEAFVNIRTYFMPKRAKQKF